jgi:hypothetical protein
MAAGKTYEPIATNTLATATDIVTFSSISGAYTDLILVINGAKAYQTNTHMRFNGDSGANYSFTNLRGNGLSVGSNRYTSVTFIYVDIATTLADEMNTKIIQINNYSNTTTYKTALVRDSAVTAEALAGVGMWRNTAAITSITITNVNNYNWNVGTMFTLYGIAAA